MGDSGALGDILSSILSKTNTHVNVVKGYHLPKTVDSNTLVVTTSISGNTIETLSVLESASKQDCKIIAFSSGGKIETFCSKNDIDYRIKDYSNGYRFYNRKTVEYICQQKLKYLGPVGLCEL